MYISNLGGNSGMATLLPQQEQKPKLSSNGNSNSNSNSNNNLKIQTLSSSSAAAASTTANLSTIAAEKEIIATTTTTNAASAAAAVSAPRILTFNPQQLSKLKAVTRQNATLVKVPNFGRVLSLNEYQQLMLKKQQQSQQQQSTVSLAATTGVVGAAAATAAGVAASAAPQQGGRSCLLMQNEMVSIPTQGTLNGSLTQNNNSNSKSSTVVGVGGSVVTGAAAVGGTAPRIYLAPASTYMAQHGTTTVTPAIPGTVRYFSQFGKLQQAAAGPALPAAVTGTTNTTAATLQLTGLGQRKLINGSGVGGDTTMVLMNGNKPLIFKTTTAAAAATNQDKINAESSSNLTKSIGAVAAGGVPNGGGIFAYYNNNNNNNSNNNHNNKKVVIGGGAAAAGGGILIKSDSNEKIRLVQLRQQKTQEQKAQNNGDDDEEEEILETVIKTEADAQQEDAANQDQAEDDDDVDDGDRQQQKVAEPLSLVQQAGKDEEPELDIVINNVVCSFSVRCHLKLRDIALHGANVEYRRENGMVTMKLRRPYTTASIWSSGRITCTGATSEVQAKIAARRYARCLMKLGFPSRFSNFRIVNVLGTCSMPWAIKIVNFSEKHRQNASYEPELHPGVTYKMREPKATLKIFSTGSITVTAASVSNVEAAIQHIYPLVHEFRKQRSPEELQHMRQKQKNQAGNSAGGGANSGPQDVEEKLCKEAKAAAEGDIFVNSTAAHGGETTSSSSSSTAASANSIGYTNAFNSKSNLQQYQRYRQLQQQTQLERRHIPFSDGAGTTTTTTTSSSMASRPAAGQEQEQQNSSSSSTGSICANARRRATERWAVKLQNKRPRYNDISSPAISAITNHASTISATVNAASLRPQPQTSTSAAAVAAAAGSVHKPGGLINSKISSHPSISSSSSSHTQQQHHHQQHHQQHQHHHNSHTHGHHSHGGGGHLHHSSSHHRHHRKQRPSAPSPTEFGYDNVDDLIEEDNDVFSKLQY